MEPTEYVLLSSDMLESLFSMHTPGLIYMIGSLSGCLESLEAREFRE